MRLHFPIRIRLRKYVCTFAVCLCVTQVSCSSALTSWPVNNNHDQPLLERLEHEGASESGLAQADESTILGSALLAEVDTVEVQQFGAVPQFHTLARKEKIVQYPCSNCHNRSLDDLESSESGSVQRAHWNIVVEHADESFMRCTTCHSPEKLDVLHTVAGDPVDFDHSYRVCAQCHSDVAEDWAGGAHGKRVGGWMPPRVVNSCVDCHNPHQPQWDTRWPALTSELSR